jgi:predicted alpha-1,6-mannanase (GH76 family)
MVCTLLALLSLVADSNGVAVSIAESRAAKTASLLQSKFYNASARCTDSIWGVSYWHDANAVEALCNWMIYSGSRKYVGVVQSVFEREGQAWRLRTGGSYDDTGWWGHAWVRAYELTGEQQYLDKAELCFVIMADAFDDTCKGGVWWTQIKKYKNAITNGLFLSLAMKMHLHTPPGNSTYIDWATKEWAWFEQSGLINTDRCADGVGLCLTVHC